MSLKKECYHTPCVRLAGQRSQKALVRMSYKPYPGQKTLSKQQQSSQFHPQTLKLHANIKTHFCSDNHKISVLKKMAIVGYIYLQYQWIECYSNTDLLLFVLKVQRVLGSTATPQGRHYMVKGRQCNSERSEALYSHSEEVGTVHATFQWHIWNAII